MGREGRVPFPVTTTWPAGWRSRRDHRPAGACAPNSGAYLEPRALLFAQRAVMERSDEIELVRLAGQGDARAFRSLSDHFLPKIVAYAQRLLGRPAEAEDVAQETFLRLWQHAARWSPDARLATWLFRVAHNLAIDRLRVRREAGSAALEHAAAEDRPSGLLQRKQLAGAVEQAMLVLPERQRAAIALCHYEGLGNPEIAAVLEVSVEAVESLLSRGRRALRETLTSVRAEHAAEGERP
jgi:RNA polymerase sigma factor (sigma-70 family)